MGQLSYINSNVLVLLEIFFYAQLISVIWLHILASERASLNVCKHSIGVGKICLNFQQKSSPFPLLGRCLRRWMFRNWPKNRRSSSELKKTAYVRRQQQAKIYVCFGPITNCWEGLPWHALERAREWLRVSAQEQHLIISSLSQDALTNGSIEIYGLIPLSIFYSRRSECRMQSKIGDFFEKHQT